jgi:hypothetical protein
MSAEISLFLIIGIKIQLQKGTPATFLHRQKCQSEPGKRTIGAEDHVAAAPNSKCPSIFLCQKCNCHCSLATAHQCAVSVGVGLIAGGGRWLHVMHGGASSAPEYDPGACDSFWCVRNH